MLGSAALDANGKGLEGLIALARTAEHPHTNWHECSHYSKAIP
jgi:hypothetical protein